MRVVVDALSAKEGGGITDVLHLLPAMLRMHPRFRLITILSSTYQQDLIRQLSAEIDVFSVPAPASRARRLHFLTSQMPKIVRSLRADALFSLSEVTGWNVQCPKVVLMRNLNLFATWGHLGDTAGEVRRVGYRMATRPFVNRTLQSADHLVFVSKSLLDHVSRRYPAITRKSSVVPLGIEEDFCKCSDVHTGNVQQPFILAVSNISPHKNYGVLLTAFSRLLRAHSEYGDMKLLIAGSTRIRGTYQDLLKYSAKLGIQDRVTFLGHVPHSRLSALYRGASLFVMPSRLESFGHPLVEAMACGVPVIAADIPVSREVCKDVAVYFSPGDPDNLQVKMHALLQDSVARASMSDRGRERAREFSWSKTAAGIGAIIAGFSDLSTVQ